LIRKLDGTCVPTSSGGDVDRFVCDGFGKEMGENVDGASSTEEIMRMLLRCQWGWMVVEEGTHGECSFVVLLSWIIAWLL
jgi:hypothetical protein